MVYEEHMGTVHSTGIKPLDLLASVFLCLLPFGVLLVLSRQYVGLLSARHASQLLEDVQPSGKKRDFKLLLIQRCTLNLDITVFHQ